MKLIARALGLMCALSGTVACGGEIGATEVDTADAGAETAEAALRLPWWWRRDSGVHPDAAAPRPDAAPVFADAAPRPDAAAPDAAPVFADAAPRPDAAAPDAAPVFADAAPRPDAALDAGAIVDAGGTADAGTPASTAWRPFNATSPWNTTIPANPAIDPGSAVMIQDFATSAPQTPNIYINTSQWSVPLYSADASTPQYSVNVTAIRGTGFQPGALTPIPNGAVPDPMSDHHMLIVDRARGLEWDFFLAQQSGNTWTCNVCATADLNGSGVRPPKDNRQEWWASHGARACGYPLSAGLITLEQVRSGRIDHALVIAYPRIRSQFYTPPASTGHPSSGSLNNVTGMMCGTRIQLDPTLDINTLGLNATGRIIARALQEYGAYVGDYSGGIALYAEDSPAAAQQWPSVMGNLDARQIPLNRFRVLQRTGATYQENN